MAKEEKPEAEKQAEKKAEFTTKAEYYAAQQAKLNKK